MPTRCWAVVPAAGLGSRMGGVLPKQYLEVAGTTILEHSLRALLASEQIAGVMVALHSQDVQASGLSVMDDARVHTTLGGAQRSDSVLAGLSALNVLADEQDWVLVHDAARPCLPVADLQRLIDTVIGSGIGGILGEPIVDTVKLADEKNQVQHTLDRDSLWRAQTPQMFRLDDLSDALGAARVSGQVVTDEASAMELAGQPVQLVAGSPRNLKVTVPSDLELAAWYLSTSVSGG